MIIETIDVSPLLKAFKKFDRFRTQTESEQEKAGAILAFEYCFELTWKTMKRILGVRGTVANSPKEVFRKAALEGFIQDPEQWFLFLEKRNLTVHTYEEKTADEVVQILGQFSSEVKKFLRGIGAPL